MKERPEKPLFLGVEGYKPNCRLVFVLRQDPSSLEDRCHTRGIIVGTGSPIGGGVVALIVFGGGVEVSSSQLGVIFGEELDWGQVVGIRRYGARNLRMALRDAGIIPYFMDAITMTAHLLFFFVSPLIPIQRFRDWWDRAIPVRGTVPDAIALLAVVPLANVAAFAAGHKYEADLVQVAGYALTAVVTLRIWKEVRA